MEYKKLTSEDIRKLYLDYAEIKIESATRLLEDVNFSKFMSLSETTRYSFFNHLPYAVSFPSCVELFGYLKYCLEDDGDLSLIKVRLSSKLDYCDRFYNRNKYIVLDSHFMELKLSKMIDRFGNDEVFGNAKVLNFVACRVDESLYDMLLEYEALLKIAEKLAEYESDNPSWINLKKYKDAENECEKLIENFILSKDVEDICTYQGEE